MRGTIRFIADSMKLCATVCAQPNFTFWEITVYLSSKQLLFFISNAIVRLTLWREIPAGPKVSDIINVIVEIQKGSQNKYEYDRKTNMIRLEIFSLFTNILCRRLWNDSSEADMDIEQNPTIDHCSHVPNKSKVMIIFVLAFSQGHLAYPSSRSDFSQAILHVLLGL